MRREFAALTLAAVVFQGGGAAAQPADPAPGLTCLYDRLTPAEHVVVTQADDPGRPRAEQRQGQKLLDDAAAACASELKWTRERRIIATHYTLERANYEDYRASYIKEGGPEDGIERVLAMLTPEQRQHVLTFGTGKYTGEVFDAFKTVGGSSFVGAFALQAYGLQKSMETLWATAK